MKLFIILILFSSCSSGRIISTNEYYADGLVQDCEKNQDWNNCYKNLVVSFNIYHELKLHNKQVFVLARLLNLIKKIKKSKYLREVNQLMHRVDSSVNKEDLELLYNLVDLSLRKKIKHLNKVVFEKLNGDVLSVRTIYIVCKFKKFLNLDNNQILSDIINAKDLDNISKTSKSYYYAVKIKELHSIK